MSRVIAIAVVVVCVTAAGLTAGALRQAGPRDGSGSSVTVPVGTGELSGVVTDVAADRPVRGARVQLHGTAMKLAPGQDLLTHLRYDTGEGILGSARLVRTVETDDSGRFSFGRMPPGRFWLRVHRAGYLEAAYGQTSYPSRGTSVLMDAGDRRQVAIGLSRGAVISGTVLDEHGEPQPGARVRAIGVAVRRGVRVPRGELSAAADDRGQYRLHGLPPGDYLLAAVPAWMNPPSDTAADDARAIEDRLRSAPPVSVAPGELGRVMVLLRRGPHSTVARLPPPLLPTYFPGTERPELAALVSLGAAGELTGTDFRVRSIPSIRITGTVVPPPGDRATVRVFVFREDDPLPQGHRGAAQLDAAGTFAIDGLTPGTYHLMATTVPTMRGSHNNPAGSRSVLDESEQLWGGLTVLVDGGPMPDVVLTMQPGRTIAGRVDFQMERPPDLARGQLKVMLVADDGRWSPHMEARPDGVIQPDGTFRITAVPPGRYLVRLSQWQLRQMTVGDRDRDDFTIDVPRHEDVSDVRLWATDRSASLKGRLVDPSGLPVVDCHVVVASVEQRFWTRHGGRVAATSPDAYGGYTFYGLPPGEYVVGVLRDVPFDGPFERDLLEPLLSMGARVTLTDGASHVQDMRITR